MTSKSNPAFIVCILSVQTDSGLYPYPLTYQASSRLTRSSRRSRRPRESHAGAVVLLGPVVQVPGPRVPPGPSGRVVGGTVH
jgi:hypothetical protein